tara:strand:+ start:2129 stop:2575 length:447 start_codon:yes stop_codon:yes gene_type:complete
MAAPISALAVVRKGVRAALNTNVTIGGNDVPILVNVKSGQAFPYIVIGGAAEEPHSVFSTGGVGSDVTINVEVWTRDSAEHSFNYGDSDDVISQIRQNLDHQTLTLGSGTFCGCHFVEVTFPEEQDDGITLRQITQYRIWVAGLGDPI